jgi:hypothetical protein
MNAQQRQAVSASRQPVRFQDELDSANAALDEPYGLDEDTKTQEWLRKI